MNNNANVYYVCVCMCVSISISRGQVHKPLCENIQRYSVL